MPRNGMARSCGKLFDFWEGTAHVFSTIAAPCHIPTSSWGIPISLHPHQDLSLLVYLKTVILMVVQWDLTVVLICVPLWLIMLYIFSCAHWPNVSIPWWNIYSNALLIFNIFNWRIIALQCCVGFCHTTTWISSKYTYAPSLLNTPSHSSRLSQSTSLSSWWYRATFH